MIFKNKKSFLITLGIVHICLFSGICTFAAAMHDGNVYVADNSITLTNAIVDTPPETDIIIPAESEPEPTKEINTDESVDNIESETETEPETLSEPVEEENENIETDASLSVNVPFSYHGLRRLNIRKSPGMNGEIIGKILSNEAGTIIEFTNDEWAKVHYKDIEGYCYIDCLTYEKPTFE